MRSPARSQLDPLRQVTTEIVRWHGDDVISSSDEIVSEEPLDIRTRTGVTRAGLDIFETIAVVMRTPGQDDELAAGFLLSEGLITHREEIVALRPGFDADGLPSDNMLDVIPAPQFDLAQRVRDEGYSRKFAVNASCGVCGKNTVDAACSTLPPIPLDDFAVTPELLYSLPDRLRSAQRVFSHTGGLHGAGLFDAHGSLLLAREDVGRHNAVDKIVGRALLDGMHPLRERVLMVSGRLSFEIVLKALAASIPIIAAVSAPSSLAIDLAQAGGITLVGFLRGSNANVYTFPERVRH